MPWPVMVWGIADCARPEIKWTCNKQGYYFKFSLKAGIQMLKKEPLKCSCQHHNYDKH